MLRNVIVKLRADDLKWIRREASQKGISLSQLVGQMIRRERLRSDSYWAAYERWKEMKPWPIDASKRMTHEEAHERR